MHSMVRLSCAVFALTLAVASAQVLICTSKQCMTEFGTKLKCSGVHAGQKTLFIQAFQGGDGRYYGYRQIAVSNLFLSEHNDDGGGAFGAGGKQLLRTAAAAAAAARSSTKADTQQAQAQAFSFGAFRGPVCVVDEPALSAHSNVVALSRPFGLCCSACSY